VLDGVLDGLTRDSGDAPAAAAAEPAPDEIVFSGSLDELHEHFLERAWTDGLPIVPPTIERVERFLASTAWPPAETIGVLLHERRALRPIVHAEPRRPPPGLGGQGDDRARPERGAARERARRRGAGLAGVSRRPRLRARRRRRHGPERRRHRRPGLQRRRPCR